MKRDGAHHRAGVREDWLAQEHTGVTGVHCSQGVYSIDTSGAIRRLKEEDGGMEWANEGQVWSKIDPHHDWSGTDLNPGYSQKVT